MPSRLSVKPRVIRVFLSSTFRDFGEERDLLVRKVFPTLRARLAERFVDLVDVDLRWGITEAEAEQGEVLPICLAEIDRARPFFIGLLGERYGWIPPTETYQPTVLEQHPWLEEHRGGKSVTELEILHGVLNNPAMAGRALFYFRSPDYAKTQGGDYLALSDQDQAKQDALKDRVRASAFPVVENYATPEDVAEQIQEDLWSALEIEFPATEVPDAFTRDLLQHEAYAAPRRRIYLGGEAYLQALDQALKDNTQWILLNGESGSGKSALIANWIERLTDEDLITHVHYVGANPSAADPIAMVRRLIEWIRRETNTEDEPASDPQELLDSLPEWLSRASAWASLNNTRFLLILDALNGISDRRDLRWFPSFLPAGVQCVVSTLSGEVRDNLMDKAPWHVIEVHPLDAQTARQVFITYLGLYNKTLPDPLIDQVMTHPLVTNPLFLMTLAEELRLFGEHEQLSQQLAHYQESLTVDDLFERVLARIEADHGAAIIRQIMTALWASRSGLREEELLAYTGLPLMKWSYIRHALGPALIESNGRYAFAHDYLRIAVSDRYMAGNNSLEDAGQSEEALTLRQEAHIRLVEWFEDHAFQDNDETVSAARAAEEIPYQWQQAKQWEQLATTLTELSLFQAITEHREQQELLAYWLAIEAQTEITLEQAYENAWNGWQANSGGSDQNNETLSDLLIYGGRYNSFTEQLLKLLVEAKIEKFGETNTDTIVAIGNLAEFYGTLDRFSEAETLYEQAISCAKIVHGPKSEEIADLYTGFATGCGIDKKREEDLLREALSIRKHLFGDKHLFTAISCSALGSHLWSVGKNYDEAEELLRVAIKVTSEISGPEHLTVAKILSQLSIFLMDIRHDYINAEAMLQSSYNIIKKTLGPLHPSTRSVIDNLGHLMDWTDRDDQAEELFREGLKISRHVYGENIDTSQAINSLAMCLSKRGKFTEAEQLFGESYSILRKFHSAEHPWAISSRHSLAVTMAQAGKLSDAEELFSEINKLKDEEDNPTSLALSWFIYELKRTKKYSKAETNLKKLIDLEATAIKRGEDEFNALYMMGEVLVLQKKYQDGASYFRWCLEVEEKQYGYDGEELTSTYLGLAECEYYLGEYHKAETILERLYDLYCANADIEPEEIVKLVDIYSRTLTSLGKNNLAKKVLKDLDSN